MEHLQRLRIVAESINSKMTVKERSRVLADLNSVNPATRLLYITPEQASTTFFQVWWNRIITFISYRIRGWPNTEFLLQGNYLVNVIV